MPRLYVVLSTTGTDHAVDQRPRSKPIVFTRPERGGKRRHSRDHPPRQAGRSDRTLLCAAVARTRASDRASRRTHACGPAPGRTALQPRRDARTVISLDTNILIYSVDRGAVERHEAAEIVARWQAAVPVEPASDDDLRNAIRAVREHRLAFWDALLWATVRRVGVELLISEDFQDRRVIEGVRILNPFVAENTRLIEAALPG